MGIDSALTAFAIDNPQCFTLIDDRADAFDLLQELIEQKLDLAAIIVRISESEIVEELFEQLVEQFSAPMAREQLQDAIVRVPRNIWAAQGGGLPENLVTERFLRPEDAVRLLTVHARALCDETHPLFGSFSPDEYWRRLVRSWIGRGAFARAWKECKRARKGFVISGHKPESDAERPTFNVDPRHRCYQATPDCRRELVRELYGAMFRAGLVPPLTDDDRRLRSNRLTFTAMRRHGDRRVPTRASVHLPGFEFAISLGAQELHPGYLLSAEGAMVVAIAKRFSEERRTRPDPRSHRRRTARSASARDESDDVATSA
ncbi:hypothetical protein HY479_01700 [Candidatus Uhrbacteria bacterium]|nr:hypothetical protein [Candidatus Uhrbacteria bacterium]